MKRVKIMLSAILVMAVVAGAFAFKAKKANGFCLYKTTRTIVEGEPNVLTCKTLGRYTIAELPAAVVLQSITITPTACVDADVFTPIAGCTTTLTVTTE